MERCYYLEMSETDTVQGNPVVLYLGPSKVSSKCWPIPARWLVHLQDQWITACFSCHDNDKFHCFESTVARNRFLCHRSQRGEYHHFFSLQQVVAATDQSWKRPALEPAQPPAQRLCLEADTTMYIAFSVPFDEMFQRDVVQVLYLGPNKSDCQARAVADFPRAWMTDPNEKIFGMHYDQHGEVTDIKVFWSEEEHDKYEGEQDEWYAYLDLEDCLEHWKERCKRNPPPPLTEEPPPKRKIKGIDVHNLTSTEYHSSRIIRATDASVPDAYIVNVIAKFNLGYVTFDMEHLAREMRHIIPVEYNPTGMKACVLRVGSKDLFRPLTMLIFESGNFVITGAGSLEQARDAAYSVGRVFMLHGFPQVQMCDFDVTNLVAAMDLGFEVDLISLHRANMGTVQYDTEQFPAARIMVGKSKSLKALVYLSGKVVITGAKKTEDIAWAQKLLFHKVSKHRKGVNRDAGLIQYAGMTSGRYSARTITLMKHGNQTNVWEDLTSLGLTGTKGVSNSLRKEIMPTIQDLLS